jgi:hypothetical protein
MLRKKILLFASVITSYNAGNLLINTIYLLLVLGILINILKML